jgi:DNA-binding transcriptional LysR family regulator
MEAAAAKLSRGGTDDSPRGLVRINAPPSLTQSFLVAPLATLAVQHLSLDIDVASDFKLVSLERRETDIALRFGRPNDGDVIAKFLVTIGFGFYASAQWLERLRAGTAPTFVGFDEANASLPETLWLARHYSRARMAFRGNSQLAQAAAARAGAGIALLPHTLLDVRTTCSCPARSSTRLNLANSGCS